MQVPAFSQMNWNIRPLEAMAIQQISQWPQACRILYEPTVLFLRHQAQVPTPLRQAQVRIILAQ
jgi:hypothetical protein